ncbi:MAG: hypothetical protein WAN69_12240 [Candidatus Korobacteraceae bacterium]
MTDQQERKYRRFLVECAAGAGAPPLLEELPEVKGALTRLCPEQDEVNGGAQYEQDS